ncbi:hypothetical protein EP331_10115 [bacterium]|nr:MAG: hypothetical protein EP331_10115 [bacterium]
MLVILTGVRVVSAQNLTHTHAVALSGGGISLVDGVGSLSLNPANLMMKSYKNGRVIELPGWALESVNGNLSTNKDEFSFRWLEPVLSDSLLFDSSWLTPMSFNDFGTEQNKTQRRNSTVTLLGASFANSSLSWGIQARNRSLGLSTIDKNLYSSSVPMAGEIQRNYSQTNLNWNEITVGFATTLDYVQGLSSNLNQIYFGLSASYMMPYSYLEMDASEQVYSTDALYKIQSLQVTSAGNANSLIQNLAEGNSSAWNGVSKSLSSLPTSIGWGLGINLGMTYEIPFLSSYAQVRHHEPVTRAIRFGASITDIGYVTINKNLTSRTIARDSTALVAASTLPALNFTVNSSLTDIYLFLSQQSRLNSPKLVSENSESITKILPMQAHAGISISYDWLKLGADAHYGLNTSLGNEQTLSLTLFSELYVLPFLPIRAGLLSQGTTVKQVSAGMSFQLLWFAWDVGVAYDYSHDMKINTPSMIAGTGLRIRF